MKNDESFKCINGVNYKTVTFQLYAKFNKKIKELAEGRRVFKNVILEEAVEYYLVEKFGYGK